MDVNGQAGTGAELTLSDYLIATDSDESLVNFVNHTYRHTPMLIGPIVDLANALDKKSPVIITKLEFDTMKVAAGDTIEGRPTRHYQLRLDYRQYQPDTLNELKPASTTFTGDYWTADVGVRFNNPFIGFLFPKPGYSPGLKVWIDKIRAAFEVVNTGTPVRFEANYEKQIEWPRPTIYKRTMDLTGCAPKDLDAALFAIPSDYKPGTGRGGG